jgi:hypothetical protein
VPVLEASERRRADHPTLHGQAYGALSRQPSGPPHRQQPRYLPAKRLSACPAAYPTAPSAGIRPVADDPSGKKVEESEKMPSAELGPNGAQTALQEALFDFAGRQGHRGVKFSGRLARVAQPSQVIRQSSVP